MQPHQQHHLQFPQFNQQQQQPHMQHPQHHQQQVQQHHLPPPPQQQPQQQQQIHSNLGQQPDTDAKLKEYLVNILSGLNGILKLINNRELPTLTSLNPSLQSTIKNAAAAQQTVSNLNKPPKKQRDPNAPKQPMTSYLLYCGDVRELIKKEHPDWSQRTIATEMGARWKQLSPDEKSKYDRLAQVKRDEYNSAVMAYRAGSSTGDKRKSVDNNNYDQYGNKRQREE